MKITPSILSNIILVTVLTTSFFLVNTTANYKATSTGEYDPWIDIDDDGDIDIYDIVAMCNVYGTKGTPLDKRRNLTEWINELHFRVNSLNTSLIALQDAMTSLGTTVNTLEADIVALNGSLTQLESEMNTLENRVTALEEDVSLLESSVAVLEAKVAVLESNVITLESAIATLETSFNMLNTKVVDLQYRVDSLNASVISLNSTVSSLFQKINILEARTIHMNTTYTSVESTTEVSFWIDMEYTSVEITVNSTSSLMIMFSAEAMTPDGQDRIWVRVQMSDGTQWFTPYPSYVYFTPKVSEELEWPVIHRHFLGYGVYSFNFYEPSVCVGTYTIKMQWRLQYGTDTGYIRSRTLTVIAFP